ncbi:MAG: TIM barrel protein [Clostridia bacterium]|nr:TIM barrel protein [Clostridia bacterium]
MKIYPKISCQEYGKEMEEVLKKSEGIEIQFFDEKNITEPFNFKKEVKKNKKKYPNLREITVHPPLKDYNLEIIFLKDENIFRKQLKQLVKLSKSLNITINLIYHTHIPLKEYISTNLDKRLCKCLKIIEGSNVYVLIENLIANSLVEKNECTALEICKYINHPNLRMCLDTTHIHCKANILKKDYYEMVKNELNKQDCEKYVKQIHFAATLKNDGYIDIKGTHGRKHESIEDVKEEYKWLEELGLRDKIFVTEVSEEDYYSRKDQLEEIKMLEEVVSL